jgi:hypothetical protein
MAQIIDPRSRLQRLGSAVKAFSPQVKQGLIGASVTLVIASAGCIGALISNARYAERNERLTVESEQLRRENQDLREKNRAITADRDTQLVRLAPFLAAADRQFTNAAVNERLVRLADALNAKLHDGPALEFFVNEFRVGSDTCITFPVTNATQTLEFALRNVGNAPADGAMLAIGPPKELELLPSGGWRLADAVSIVSNRLDSAAEKAIFIQGTEIFPPNTFLKFDAVTVRGTTLAWEEHASYIIHLSAAARNSTTYTARVALHLTNGQGRPYLGR